MRFTFEGKTFVIEFQRERKVPASSAYGVERTYTTARLLEVTGYTSDNLGGKTREERRIVREYTVGYNPNDRFTYEGGRKAALTKALWDSPTMKGGKALLGDSLSKEFRTAVWQAYHSRTK